MNAKLSPNLCSFIMVRRGEWIIKVSVFRNREILLIGQHYYERERVIVKHFTDYNIASDYIDNLAKESQT